MKQKNEHIILILCVYLCLSSTGVRAQKVTLFAGISKKTESFNIKDIRNSQVSQYDHIQYSSRKFFGSFNGYFEGRLQITKSVYSSVKSYFRYNHHFYKKLIKPQVLEQNLPAKRQFKMDFFLDAGKSFFFKKEVILFVALGVGLNNIHSGYNFTYNDTTAFGQPFNGTFKGNWLKCSPGLTLGLEWGKYFISTDVMFTKDPTFENLPSVNIGFTFARRLMAFK
jgi:hypothetical protein